uniref:Peptidase S1 domain-containing protein n=1 Tax=Panagrolaimus superbus TaxID=310955 RepID=A0A914Z4Y8_9BILA
MCADSKPFNTYQCGVLGGKESNPSDWPFVAKIINGKSYCTATIIDEQWILSAAHCNEKSNPLTVIINGNEIYTTNETYLHESYDRKNNFINDIMLIKLPTPVKFSKNVSSICLQKNIIAKNGDTAVLAGFGKRFDRVKNIKSTYDEDGIPIENISFNQTNSLHEVEVLIKDMDFCFKAESQSTTKICAGGKMRGVTQGDSGGPLAIVRNNHWIQYGISSTVRFTGVEADVNKELLQESVHIVIG